MTSGIEFTILGSFSSSRKQVEILFENDVIVMHGLILSGCRMIEELLRKTPSASWTLCSKIR
jgi:hypothetical protein